MRPDLGNEVGAHAYGSRSSSFAVCLVAFAIDRHPTHRLVLVGNRDESTARPAAPLARWADAPGVIAGRDLTAGGTWLGITESGRWGVVTNIRDPRHPRDAVQSRGALVAEFLRGTDPASDYAQRVFDVRNDFDGFNLVVGDVDQAVVVSTRSDSITVLGPGVYGLSNDQLDTPWPKVIRARIGLRAWLGADPARLGDLLDLVEDTNAAPDDSLPDTGVGLDWERRLSPMRIVSDGYGTRVSTALTIDGDGNGRIVEQTWNADGTRGSLAEVGWVG